MIRVYILVALFIITPVLIILAYTHWKWAKKVGTVVLAYAIGILLALCGYCTFEDGTMVDQTYSQIRSLLMNITVPLAIPLMLFNCDFQLWTKALPKTLWALLGGLIAVLLAAISGYFIFQNVPMEEFNKIAAMMTGIYTGGTMNFNALGVALETSEKTITIVLAFQMLITTPYILFLIGGGYKIFRRLLPFQDITARGRKDKIVQTNDIESYRGMFQKDNLLGMLKGLGLSVLFLAIGAGIALLTTGTLNELVVILTITTLSILASFFKKVRQLPKTFELGMFFILIFSVIVASMFDIHSVHGESFFVGAYVLWVLLISAILHLLFCRVAKVSGDLFTISQVALLCSPPFVPPVAAAMKNKKVLISGIVIGLIGYAIGTYLGVLIYWLL